MSTPQQPPRSPGDEARAALEAVLRDQAERSVRRDVGGSSKARDRGPLLQSGVAALAVATAWLWVAPPSIIQPPPIPEAAPELMEAELRMTVYQAVLRVEKFQDSVGSLPAELAQAFEGPEDLEGLTYQRLDEHRFRLTGVRGASAVLFESGDSLSSLLGMARRIMADAR